MDDAIHAGDDASHGGKVCQVRRDEFRVARNCRRRPDVGQPQLIGVMEECGQPRADVACRAGDEYALHWEPRSPEDASHPRATSTLPYLSTCAATLVLPDAAAVTPLSLFSSFTRASRSSCARS